MLIMIPLSYNIRSLLVRKTTTFATALGIGLVVFVFSSVLMLSNGIRKTMGSTGRKDNAILLAKGNDAELSSTVESNKASIVLAKPEIAQSSAGAPLSVSEVVVNMTLDRVGTSEFSNVQVRGVPFATVWDFRPEVKILPGGRKPTGKNEVLVGKAIAGNFKGLTIGGEFDLKTNVKLTVVGIISAGGSSFESEIWADAQELRDAFGRGTTSSSLRVRLQSADAYDAFKAGIDADPQLGLDVYRESSYYEKQSEGLALFITVLGSVIAILFGVGAAIGASITMNGSIASRQREIGTLRALGFGRIGILFSFLLESIALALIGGAFGAVASLAMGWVEFSTMNPASWSEIVFSFTPEPGIIVSSLVFAGFLGIGGGILPAWRASRISPVKAMRG